MTIDPMGDGRPLRRVPHEVAYETDRLLRSLPHASVAAVGPTGRFRTVNDKQEHADAAMYRSKAGGIARVEDSSGTDGRSAALSSTYGHANL